MSMLLQHRAHSLNLQMSDRSLLSLSLKTLEIRSGQSEGDCPGKRFSVISVHLGLHVNVKKRSGLPNLATVAMASW